MPDAALPAARTARRQHPLPAVWDTSRTAVWGTFWDTSAAAPL